MLRQFISRKMIVKLIQTRIKLPCEQFVLVLRLALLRFAQKPCPLALRNGLHKLNNHFSAYILLALIGLPLLTLAQDKSDVDPTKPKLITRTLISGVTETINFDFTPGNIIIGDKAVCEFIPLREQKQITLIPKKVGKTSLTVFDTSTPAVNRMKIDITVIISDRAKTARELQELLGEIEGIKIKILGKKVLVDGEILLPSDLNRIVAVWKQYPEEEVGIIATLSPLAQKIIADKIQEDIQKMGFKEVRVRAINQRFLLEGTVDRGPDGDVVRNSTLVENVAKSYVPDVFVTPGEKADIIKRPEGGPPIVVNLLIVKPKPAAESKKLIRIMVHFVELNKDYAKSFAFNWTPGIRDTSAIELKGGQLTTTITGTISSLIPKLNSAKSHGFARVLESTSLIVQDDIEGYINNLTKIPITKSTISGGATQESTEYTEVGLSMRIKPTIIPESSQINLHTTIKLSSVLGLERGAPLIGQNEMDTTLIIASSESAAVGGLVSNTMGTSYNKLPSSIQADQNLLFNLYRSKSFQNQKSQFIVFITPEILKSASEGAEELKRKFRLK